MKDKADTVVNACMTSIGICARAMFCEGATLLTGSKPAIV